MEEIHRPHIIMEGPLLGICIILYLFVWAYNLSAPAHVFPTLQALCYDLVVSIAVLFAIVVIIKIYGMHIKSSEASNELVNLMRLIAYPIIAILLLDTLGINVTSILVGAGFLGIVVGLAAQTTLGNLFSGFSILYTKPFSVGEKISVSTPQYSIQSPTHPHGMLEVEVTGFVKSVGIMHTKLLRDDMTMVYIPNSIMNNGLITNYSRAPERLVVLRADLNVRVNTRKLKARLAAAFNTKEFSGVKDLTINSATVTTDSDVGIIISGRVDHLDYHKYREAMADKLNEVLSKKKR